MLLSLNITNYSWPGAPDVIAAQLGAIAEEAESAGLHTILVAAHLLQADPTSTPDAEMLEAHTILGFLAARTESVRLGPWCRRSCFAHRL